MVCEALKDVVYYGNQIEYKVREMKKWYYALRIEL